MRYLPEEHPSINGCVNLKNSSDLSNYSFSSWEEDDQGMIYMVDVYMGLTDEDRDFALDMQATIADLKIKPPLSSYLPLSLQKWFNETPINEWYYDVKASKSSNKNLFQYRFFFEKASDALMFKLKWGNSNE